MNEGPKSIANISLALTQLQSELAPAVKDSRNPHFNAAYASLQAVWESVRTPLAKNGLSVAQTFSWDEVAGGGANVVVHTILMHKSGESIESKLRLVPTKNDPQGIGSAITYGRRYGLAAMLGVVADEDDDGNAASAPRTQPQAAPARRAAPKPTPAAPTPSGEGSGHWRDVKIHFGKKQGITLGWLADHGQLDWWMDTWQPKEFKGEIAPENILLRKALDAAKAELSAGAGAVREDNTHPTSDIQDDPPF